MTVDAHIVADVGNDSNSRRRATTTEIGRAVPRRKRRVRFPRPNFFSRFVVSPLPITPLTCTSHSSLSSWFPRFSGDLVLLLIECVFTRPFAQVEGRGASMVGRGREVNICGVLFQSLDLVLLSHLLHNLLKHAKLILFSCSVQVCPEGVLPTSIVERTAPHLRALSTVSRRIPPPSCEATPPTNTPTAETATTRSKHSV